MAACNQELVPGVLQNKTASIKKINEEIWNNPETSWNEKHAHNILTTFLRAEGFEVEKNFVKETGFRATFEVSKDRIPGDASPPNICFLCQYDALPEIGHGAGHNLTTSASVAAALCVKQALIDNNMDGKVTLLGTPGEDCGGGGKIDMIQNRVFNDVNVCLMAIPMTFNALYPSHFRLLIVTVQYEGKAAHASAFPWEGRNALDAAVACYNNIALLRQQLKPTWMINGIISHGGTQPNLIPAHTEMKFWIRAPTPTDMFLIQQKCAACFVAAAKATNTTAHFEFEDSAYEVMDHNKGVGELYRKHATALGMEYDDTDGGPGETHVGSTDMGNVSLEVPSICPTFSIKSMSVLHSPSFHDDCGTPEAFESAMKAGEALALTGLQLLQEPAKLHEVMQSHNCKRRNSTQEVYKRSMSSRRMSTDSST